MAPAEDRSCFETERLIFRNWTLGDLDSLHAVCADARVMQHVAAGHPWSREETERFISAEIAACATRGYCRWALIHRADTRLVGFCGFVPADEGLEIGWRLAAEYWGQGLATEAARRALSYGFETLGYRRIIATIQAANRPSLRVAEKLGLTPERHCFSNDREAIVYAAHQRIRHVPC